MPKKKQPKDDPGQQFERFKEAARSADLDQDGMERAGDEFKRLSKPRGSHPRQGGKPPSA